MRRGEDFREILKTRARGPEHLGPLSPETCERAMELILSGAATPAQIGGFLLVGRAAGDHPSEMAAYARAARSFVRKIRAPEGPPVLTVTGGFDGKLRTLNVGAAASIIGAAAGARMLMLGCDGTPPKEGRTTFDALRSLGIIAPQTLREADSSLAEHGFAAMGVDQYLPELYALLGLRSEMARRTVLNVVEKLVSPVSGSRFLIGITHRPFLRSVSEALARLGVERALVVQAIEGSDEAPLDGNSSLVRLHGGETEELCVSPDSLGLSKVTRAQVPWLGREDETGRVLDALAGGEAPVLDLLLYNAALRLWTTDVEDATLVHNIERARAAIESGAALKLLETLRRGAWCAPERPSELVCSGKPA